MPVPGDVLTWDRVIGQSGVDLSDPTPTYLADAQGRLLYANPAFRRIRETYPQALADLTIDDIETATRVLGRPLRQDCVLSLGERVECFVSELSVVHDAQDRAVAVLGRLLPATETERLERALAVAEDRLDDLQRLVSDWVWECDAEMRLTHVSDRVFDRLGYLPQELVGSPLTSLTLDRQMWIDELAAPDRRRPFRDRPVAMRHKEGGKRTFELSAVCRFNDSDGKFCGYRGIARDVTERDAQLAALVKAVDDAEAANRAKTEFLANMSHELRTPLNAIMGFAEIMKLETFGPVEQPKYQEYFRDILRSSDHLLNVINDILDIAKIEAGKVELDEAEVEVTEIFAAVERFVRDNAERSGISVCVRNSGPLPRLLADERRLRQVLLNILSNAVKFTPPGGRVEMSAELAEEGLEIVIRDSGIGMEPAQIAVAMAPFGQVDSGLGRKYDGTGLGLPLSKALTDLHGGRFRLESIPGTGTTVTIWLPPERVLQD